MLHQALECNCSILPSQLQPIVSIYTFDAALAKQ